MRVLLLLSVTASLSGASLYTFAEALLDPNPDDHPESMWLAYSCLQSASSTTDPIYSGCTAGETIAEASAAYGSVTATAGATSVFDLFDSFAYAEAWFSDTIVFEGPHLTGFARFSYNVRTEPDYLTDSENGVFFTGGAKIAFGQPFSFGATAFSRAVPHGSRSGGGSATALLQYILVTDADGKPLQGVSLGPSEAGIVYPLHSANLEDLPPPMATPEPRLALLVAATLAAVGWRKRERS